MSQRAFTEFYQPDLVPVPKVHKRVRQTSRAQYAVARERLKGRAADVLRWLAHYWNRFQSSPTSAELAYFAYPGQYLSAEIQVQRLYVRRGMSDLQTTGDVEDAGTRICNATGRKCHVWRVKSR